MNRLKVLIIGGGFGGLRTAQELKSADLDVLVIDRSNYHLFQPLLYQVATAALSPGDIASPIREVLRKQENTSVIMAEVTAINLHNREVVTKDGAHYGYDYLVLAPGASHSYFGHPEWERYAPGLKTMNDAIEVRDRILVAYELAERCTTPFEAEKYLRFVIVGGGPTGVEIAGAIAEIARYTMVENFRKIKPEQTEIYLIEGTDRLLNGYPQKLCDRARSDLEAMGVQVLLNTKVTEIEKEAVHLGERRLEASTIIWAAGNEASPLLKSLLCPLDRAGRALVESDLSLPNHPEVFVIGDAARVMGTKGEPLPGVAPAALQAGTYVANIIAKGIQKPHRKAFEYFDKGSMATIGKRRAVAMFRDFTFTGFIAWLMWGLIHIVYLVNFRNRVSVMLQWMFWYVSGKRNVRLIRKPIDE